MALIADTGPLYAALDSRDAAHEVCRGLFTDSDERVVVPAPVVVELEWVVTSRMGYRPFDAFLRDVEEGAVEVADLTHDDWARVRALCDRYEDLPLGLVDASVVAIAERLGERSVATLDHRHFTVVRPRHVRALELLP